MNFSNAAHLLKTKSWDTHGDVVYPEYTVKANSGIIWPFLRAICWCRCCCVIYCGCCQDDEPPVIVKPGIIYSDVDDGIFHLGDFEFVWSSAVGGNARTLSISHDENVVWASTPGHNFVGGANVSLQVTESRGSIEIAENVARRYSQQSVEKIVGCADTLTISGRLSHKGKPGEGSAYYALDFHLCNRSPRSRGFDLQIYGGGTKKSTVNQAQLILSSTASEALYGFGKQASQVNCKGFEIPVVTEEGGIGRGDKVPLILSILGVEGETFSSYAPSPHVLSNTGRSLFLVNTEPSTFDLRPDSRFSVRVQASRMQGCMLSARNPLDAIELVTEFVGRMPPLPDWVNKGAIVSLQGGTERVREIWQKLKDSDTPLAGIWLQDWVGRRETAVGKQLWWNWSVNPTLYPDFGDLVNDLKEAGVATGLYINPFLVDVPDKELNGRRNLYQEAKEGNFLVKKEDGDIYTVEVTFPAAIVDLSNEEARSWLKEVIKSEMLDIGAKFWMADFGEAAQFDGVFQSGQSGLTYHNQYPIDWARLNREAIEEADSAGDSWFFTRSGFLTTPTYTTAMWLGDQNVNWGDSDGLPSSISGLLSGGFSGLSISHSDIGGYTSISNKFLLRRRRFVRSRELLYRWTELNAFTAIFRTHEGLEPSKNIQVYTDEDTLMTFARWAKVYAFLEEYRSQLILEAANKGYPIVRHPIMHYPSDRKLYDTKDTFMLGNLFYVSPVVKEGATKKVVYLPGGQWTHLWSGETFNGGTSVDIDAPVGTPPVFYVKDAKLAVEFAERLYQDDTFKGGIINRPKVLQASVF